MRSCEDRRIINAGMNPPIAILTDFGSRDPFVGIMKGVIAGINPQVQLIDLNNHIPAGDIQRAAITLWQARKYFPSGTIFLTVVDPGVGTERRPIIMQAGDYTFVGPDNGVFSFVYGENAQAWELANPDLMLPDPGNTFHGRDIFAAAAAHASRGIPGPEFGASRANLELIPAPQLDAPSPDILRGEVLHADHFGNLLTSLGEFHFLENASWRFDPWIGESATRTIDADQSHVELPDGDQIAWVKTFGQIPPGQCAALVGSSGLIEIVANRQSAAEMLELSGGESIKLYSGTDGKD